MYVLSYILGYGQLLVLNESLSVLLDVSWYCYNCSLYQWANKVMMMMMTTTMMMMISLRTDRHTDRYTHHNTSQPLPRGSDNISVNCKKYYVTIPHPVVPDILSHKNINRTRDRHLTLFPWKTSVPITLKDLLESNLIKAHIVWCMPWWASLLQRMTLRDRSA